VIIQWLEGENDLIRDRIRELLLINKVNCSTVTNQETDRDYDE